MTRFTHIQRMTTSFWCRPSMTHPIPDLEDILCLSIHGGTTAMGMTAVLTLTSTLSILAQGLAHSRHSIVRTEKIKKTRISRAEESPQGARALLSSTQCPVRGSLHLGQDTPLQQNQSMLGEHFHTASATHPGLPFFPLH